MVIHSFADGLALGSSIQGSDNSNLDTIIFFVILLHHLPASIGFSTYLVNKKIETTRLLKHFLCFTLSAPTSTILVYFIISTLNLKIKGLVGICLLISAGTFLYVSLVHILPELTHGKRMTNEKFLWMIGGLLTPIILL